MREKQSVFELDGVPAFSQFWEYGILRWQLVYKGYVPEWHNITSRSVAREYGTRRMASMQTAKALCSEVANLVWAENCSVEVNSTADEDIENSRLNRYIQQVLKGNNFSERFRKLIEQAFAMGGGAIRCYVDGDKDENGNITGNARVKMSYYTADRVVPLSWDNHRIKECIFIDKTSKRGKYYTRLEWHTKDGNSYKIKNELYVSDSTNILGFRCPLSDIYNNISDEVEINDIDSVFAYFPTSTANNLDENSPLGISIYGNAMDTLRALDIAFDSFSREFVLGKKRIIVPASAVRSVRDSNGIEHRYFDSTDEVYEALNTDSPDQLKIVDNTIELRIDEHISAINALLNILSFQVGLSAGALSFDKATGLKTATEVVSENSKTFRFVKLQQEPIKNSIEQLIESIISLSELYDISFEGQSIRSMIANGWDYSVNFDDSIIEDKSENISKGLLLVQNKLMSKRAFMLNVLGYTPERADSELEMLNAEAEPSLNSPFNFATE